MNNDYVKYVKEVRYNDLVKSGKHIINVILREWNERRISILGLFTRLV